jgi:hypothetical protein
MAAGLSITAQLTALLADMPGPFADAAVRAGWVRRKAAVLRRIAAEDDVPGLAGEAAVLARCADEQADRIEGRPRCTP